MWLMVEFYLGVWPNASCLCALTGQGLCTSSLYWKLDLDPSSAWVTGVFGYGLSVVTRSTDLQEGEAGGHRPQH